MRKRRAITLIVLLLAVAPALAWAGRTEMVALGRITAVDLQPGILMLDTGQRFTLAPTVQYTTTPGDQPRSASDLQRPGRTDGRPHHRHTADGAQERQVVEAQDERRPAIGANAIG